MTQPYTRPTEAQGLALMGAEDPYFTTWVRPNTLDALIRRSWVVYLGSGAHTDAKRISGQSEYRLTDAGHAALEDFNGGASEAAGVSYPSLIERLDE